ncbi:hypothetical protein H310_09626 [Aphanomyces invadans]|uniref:Uncharacterized protein n=1 Tax=Aphanomyces invadans TaxID=157072 RepID=A0A024TT97_9STRA|nr:hypothetical protein H310_09626 [Aphanomyces invadans]ETV97263.1 hypothetical protein H310_09626 [Aphanomyces invadans]|eukprot:XP_008873971.1 hypothetical protein H310_09626 [Aphanomyces invadans]
MSDISDSDAVPHGTAVITLVKPPKLTSFSPEFLVEWTKKWEKFKRDLKEECTRTKRDYTSAIPSIRSLAEPADLLDDMIEYCWHVTEDVATDEFVLKKMDEILAKPLNNAIPDAENALSTLKWDLDEKDVSMRVVRFLGGARRLLKENALLGDLEGNSRRKKIIYILISKVKPGVLRETLRQKVERILDENPTFGLTDLSKELMELALENQRAFDAAKRNAKKPTPEKRKMDDDLSSGRDTKHVAITTEAKVVTKVAVMLEVTTLHLPEESLPPVTSLPGKGTRETTDVTIAEVVAVDAVMVDEAEEEADHTTEDNTTRSPSTETLATTLILLNQRRIKSNELRPHGRERSSRTLKNGCRRMSRTESVSPLQLGAQRRGQFR